MNVVTYTVPEKAFYDANISGIELMKTVESLLKKSDFVSVHVPLLPSTKGMIN